VEATPVGCHEGEAGPSRRQRDPKGRRPPRVSEGKSRVGPQRVDAVATGARDELADPITRLAALRVVLVPGEDERGASPERPPERVHIRLIAVRRAGAEL
jgi:hypothetical protein